MRSSAPRRPAECAGLWRVALLLACLPAPAYAGPPAVPTTTVPTPTPVPESDDAARQVTVFGVLAMPGVTAADPKLAKVEAQLRKLLPGHGFRLVEVKTRRLRAGQTVRCDLGGDYSSTTTLTRASNDNGKVQLLCTVLKDKAVVMQSMVTTPANQLFFCDKRLPDGTHLLVGIGAR